MEGRDILLFSEESDEETEDFSENNEISTETDNAPSFQKNLSLKNEIIDEAEEIATAIKTTETISDGINDVKDFLSALKEAPVFSLVRYNVIQDIIAKKGLFLVDGDALLVKAITNANYDQSFGGQILHLIYICEKELQLFLSPGNKFALVFWKEWESIWKNNISLLLARKILKEHFKKRKELCNVHEFELHNVLGFFQFINDIEPTFIVINMAGWQYKTVLKSDFSKLLCDSFYLFQSLMYIMKIDCVDINLDIDVISVRSYECQARPEFSEIFKKMYLVAKRLTDYNSKEKENLHNNLLLKTLIKHMEVCNLRNTAILYSATAILSENPKLENFVKALLLYEALMEIIPIKYRGCSITGEKIPQEPFVDFVKKVHFYMNDFLLHLSKEKIHFEEFYLPDFWHGNLFVKVIFLLNTFHLRSKENLGEPLYTTYSNLLEKLNDLVVRPIEEFPILFNMPLNHCVDSTCSKSDEATQISSVCIGWIKTTCELTELFCGDVIKSIKLTTNYDEITRCFIERNENFEEKYHWHSLKPLSDDFQRISDTRSSKSTWYDQKIAKFLNFYGSNIEGRSQVSETIVVSNEKGKNKKLKKLSQKAIDIIKQQEILKKFQQEKKDNAVLSNMKLLCKSLMADGNLLKALDIIKLDKSKLITEQAQKEVAFLMGDIYFQLITLERTWRKQEIINIFLLIKELLFKHRETPDFLKQLELEKVSFWLHSLNFKKISDCWQLPQPKCSTTILQTMPWAQFQLSSFDTQSFLGFDDVEKDEELDFKPDPWQKELLNVIKQEESAIVVAPTSSGKTFASYYCMKKVLKESNEGVVVYVSPTKALVNQVAATVYARFKNKKMPPGKAVHGIFTRDYRSNVLNSQILVTVPECLQILLLSPFMLKWVTKIRYIIFDEVHCLSGQAGGLSWESCLLLCNCPFIALSATIENPQVLYSWLSAAGNLKEQLGISSNNTFSIKLIVHEERHTDLSSHIFSNGEINYVHPFSVLNLAVLKDHCGIPKHIKLSPREVLELYNALFSVMPSMCISPEEYFENVKTGFLTKSDLVDYEKQLKSFLEELAHTSPDSFIKVISNLTAVHPNEAEVGTSHIINSLLELVDLLKKKEMLPALIFTYNKSLLEYLFEEVTDCYYDLSVKNEKKSKKLELGENLENLSKDEIKNLKKRLRKNDNYDKSSGKTLNLLTTTDSSGFQSLGVADSSDLKYISWRLRKFYKQGHIFIRGLQQGIGYHHSGLNSISRSSVEMLFRMRVLNIVFATGTLALGIHMPCKSVVIAGKNQFVDPLTYQQMSGRAGRRGFDTTGNVIFWGVNERDIRGLMTGKLPNMVGNFPLNISLILRLLFLVSKNSGANADSRRNAISRVQVFLNCPLSYQNKPELKSQMKHFFAFSIQFLMIQRLLDCEGNPQYLSGLVTHLHYHEPGNIVFAYLLRCGAIQRICEDPSSRESQMKLVLLLSYLFARVPLHSSFKHRKRSSSVVTLPDLPGDITKDIDKYNEEVNYIFGVYFSSVAASITNSQDDNTLPLTNIHIHPKMEATFVEGTFQHRIKESPPKVCSSFAALSGNSDKNLFCRTENVTTIRNEISTSVNILPILDYKQKLNSYAYDFFNHGMRIAIVRENKIKHGDDFNKLKDFLLVLESIHTSLCEINLNSAREENQNVIQTFENVENKFRLNFYKAFDI